jgi:hypothetical protein
MGDFLPLAPAHFRLPAHQMSCQCPVWLNRYRRIKVQVQTVSEGLIKITRASVEAAWRRRKQDQRLIIRDKECRGLALVVNATAMRWEYAYRPRGTDPLSGRRWPNRTVTLGNPETHSPDDARYAANNLKGQAKAGADPAAEKRAKAEAERRKRSTTLGRLLDDYAKALPGRPKMRGAGLRRRPMSASKPRKRDWRWPRSRLVPTIAEPRVVIRGGNENDPPGDRDHPDG